LLLEMNWLMPPYGRGASYSSRWRSPVPFTVTIAVEVETVAVVEKHRSWMVIFQRQRP
jgi:hypothetical protein